MNLYDYIWKRKSTRKYDMTPLEPELLEKIIRFAENLKPLYSGIEIAFAITSSIKSIKPIKAPHYFIISSKKSYGCFENVGFMFQQMDLYLSSLGLGSCWLGMGKPVASFKTKLPHIITLAFGKAAGSPHREPTELKRKSLAAISKGLDDRLEAARVAPSAMNNQNWFFGASNGKIDVYYKKATIAVFTKLNKIDIGIALCHLFIATEHSGEKFVFSTDSIEHKKGYIYVGTIIKPSPNRGD